MSHNFSFFRAGGFNQVRFTCGADLLQLDQLDQKLWVALACPTKGLVFDERTLALIDSDGDGRIRASELIAALQWAGSLLRDPDELLRAPAALPLTAIDTEAAGGQQILQAAQTVLRGLGNSAATTISVAETAAALAAFNAMPFNGDGVVTAASAAGNAAAQALIEDMLKTVGAVADRSGSPGVDSATADAFFAAVTAWLQWYDQAQGDPALRPLQDDTAAALDALAGVRAKIDDYFVR